MSLVDSVEAYRPSESEPFMNERQRDYFRRKLLAWKEEILREARETPISRIARRPRQTDPSNCGRAIASAS